MAGLTITGLHKRYGGFHALKGIDLTIQDGSFAVFVGPSGCGKSTLLRSIAGLEDVDEGKIAIGGEDVTDLRPRDRDIAMVFQNYALYPYLTVFENIAFGLRSRKFPETEIRRRVGEAAEILGITALLDRLPRHLSGGQRQRVAIGRAIVRQAKLFLFDEPLSNLDAKLRDEMRGEIKRLHKEIGKTMVYVTHDQVEAMTLADRIMLLRDGRIEQEGAPLDLFERPSTGFVASFLGSPTINLIPGRLVTRGGRSAVVLDTGESLDLPAQRAKLDDGERPILLGIRPQYLTRAAGTLAAGHARIEANADLIQPTGTRTFVTSHIGGVAVTAELAAHDVDNSEGRIAYALDMARAILIDPSTDKVI